MKKCQKCFSENDDLMSFCWECGTPLPNSFDTSAKTEQFPAQTLPSAPTVFNPNAEPETVVNRKYAFNSNFQQPQPPPKSNKGIFLAVGGVAALLILGFITFAGVIIYNLIPKDDRNLTNTRVSPTPWTVVATPTPKTTPTVPPQVSFTPPTEPTKQGNFTIYANQGWQLSDIDVVPLEEFTTRVDGKADIAGVKTGISSSGVADAKTKSRRIYQEFPTGALLMRTRYADGKYSNVVAITANGANGNWRNYPDERGKIEFCINDNAPENNGGQFTVTVKLTRVPKAKK